MMCQNSRVAAVIVNWNKKNQTVNLLKSLEDIGHHNYEVIVVDNASTDGSVGMIREGYPNIRIVQNRENLGGTGGFNTGIRLALAEGGFKYIWVLDNDAGVEADTLSELTKAMEKDERIGLAGSRILDTERNDVTVEAGAFFREDTIGVKPLFQNEKNLEVKTEIEDVDYVAICSALIRVSALEKVGLMDERFFIFWDDMDWGLRFKKNGYRVVAVLNSVSYHPAFTEKRSPFMDFYYGSRNSLLTYAKHFQLFKRSIIFYNFLRYRCKVLIFLGFSGKKQLMKIGFEGILDFIIGRWGRKEENMVPGEESSFSNFPKKLSKVLILDGGNVDEIYDALHKLRESFPNAEYSLLMTEDRLGLFANGFQHITKVNTKKKYNLSYLFLTFVRVLIRRYDMAVNFRYPSPYSYAVKRAYTFEASRREFRECASNLRNIWRLIVPTLLGEITAFLLLPIVYASSLKHGRSEGYLNVIPKD